MRNVPAGPVFLLAVAALCALDYADLRVAVGGFREGTNYGDLLVGPERVVLARSVEMHPGDRLIAHVEVPGANPRLFASYDLLIVKGGDRFHVFDGNETATYWSEPDIDPAWCCTGRLLTFDRPDDAAYHEDPVPQPTPGPHLSARDMTRGAAQKPHLLDLVWVFSYRDDAALPQDDAGWRAFEASLNAELSRSPPTRLRDPVVFDAAAVRLRPVLLTATEATALVAALAVATWTVQLHLASRAQTLASTEEAPGTERLLRLHAAAGLFLARLRDLAAGAVAAGLLLLLYASLAVERAKKLGPAEEVFAASMPPTAGQPIPVLLLVALAAALYALWHVQRALGRWRRRAASAPLDL